MANPSPLDLCGTPIVSHQPACPTRIHTLAHSHPHLRTFISTSPAALTRIRGPGLAHTTPDPALASAASIVTCLRLLCSPRVPLPLDYFPNSYFSNSYFPNFFYSDPKPVPPPPAPANRPGGPANPPPPTTAGPHPLRRDRDAPPAQRPLPPPPPRRPSDTTPITGAGLAERIALSAPCPRHANTSTQQAPPHPHLARPPSQNPTECRHTGQRFQREPPRRRACVTRGASTDFAPRGVK